MHAPASWYILLPPFSQRLVLLRALFRRLHSLSKPDPGEPHVLLLGCLCDFRGISFPQPLARGRRVGFVRWQVAGKPARVQIGREIARNWGLIGAEDVRFHSRCLQSLGFARSSLPEALAVPSSCVKESVSSKTGRGAKHPANGRVELCAGGTAAVGGKCCFTCPCLTLGLFAVESKIGGDF